MLVKAFVRRRGAEPWALDPREPPHSTLVIRAGPIALTRELVARIRERYPAAEISVVAPEPLADETNYELGLPVIPAPSTEAFGYRIRGDLARTLRERRFDTAVVAGEGARRAELLALLSGAARRVGVRGDGASHVFWFSPYKPLLLIGKALARLVEKLTLTVVVGLVWTGISLEGHLWDLRRRWSAAQARS